MGRADFVGDVADTAQRPGRAWAPGAGSGIVLSRKDLQMTPRLRKLFILGIAVMLMGQAFAVGVFVGAWLSGHRPDMWTLSLPAVSALFAFGLLCIVVERETPRP